MGIQSSKLDNQNLWGFSWCLFILRNVVHFKMLHEFPICVCYFMSKHVERKTPIVYVLKQNIWHFVKCQFHSK